MTSPALAAHSSLVRRGLWLNWATAGYNSLEGIIALAAGAAAGSVALIGFGFDSLIELAASAAALRRLAAEREVERRMLSERRTRRIIGGLFLALAGYVVWDGISSLLQGDAPHRSVAGIVLAAASLIVMPWLAYEKRAVARALGSIALEAESKQTLVCTWLSAVLLGGLGLNAVAGWWWADPIAGLFMVPLIAREGIDGLRGADSCCDVR